MAFVLDVSGDSELINRENLPSDSDGNKTCVSKLLQDFKDNLKSTNININKSITEQEKCRRSNKISKTDLTIELFHEMGWGKKPSKTPSTYAENADDSIEKILSKSVITPEFESLHSVPPYEISQKKLKEQRKKEAEKTKGKKWFGLPATEMTEEVKRDLEIIQMRSVLDPKHFYKKNDMKILPKYFQIGKVIDSPTDYYNNRLTKKERKKTLVDELLADAEFNKYNKRKYLEIVEEKQKTHYKAWRQAKRLKKRK